MAAVNNRPKPQAAKAKAAGPKAAGPKAAAKAKAAGSIGASKGPKTPKGAQGIFNKPQGAEGAQKAQGAQKTKGAQGAQGQKPEGGQELKDKNNPKGDLKDKGLQDVFKNGFKDIMNALQQGGGKDGNSPKKAEGGGGCEGGNCGGGGAQKAEGGGGCQGGQCGGGGGGDMQKAVKDVKKAEQEGTSREEAIPPAAQKNSVEEPELKQAVEQSDQQGQKGQGKGQSKGKGCGGPGQPPCPGTQKAKKK